MSRLPFDVARWLFIYRKGSVSFDVDIITNSEHVSITDNDLKLCVQRMQHETKGSSNYDIMTTDYYLFLTARSAPSKLQAHPLIHYPRPQ